MRPLLPLLLALAAAASAGEAPDALVTRTWTIDGVERSALVHPSATAGPAPLLFAFHGHGGGMANVAERAGYHRLWPEAVVVYMQGLPTPGKTDPEGRLPGWQKEAGDQGDRDLRFFDAVLATMRQAYAIDRARIYATGHSNGGAFTYLLWGVRDIFAAIAPSASGARIIAGRRPLPLLHIAGRTDTIVPFANQQRTISAALALNGCDDVGEPWPAAGDLIGTLYPSSGSTPVVTLVHAGGHAFPAAAPPLIVEFLKQHRRPEPQSGDPPAEPAPLTSP